MRMRIRPKNSKRTKLQAPNSKLQARSGALLSFHNFPRVSIYTRMESRRGKGKENIFLPFPRLLSIRACSHAENTRGPQYHGACRIIFYHCSSALACLMIVPDQARGNGILFIAEHSITFSWVKLLNQEHMLCLVLSLIVVDVYIEEVQLQAEIQNYNHSDPITVRLDLLTWSNITDKDDSLYILSHNVSLTANESNIDPESADMSQLTVTFSLSYADQLCFNENEELGFSSSDLCVILNNHNDDGLVYELDPSDDDICPNLNEFHTAMTASDSKVPLITLLVRF